MNERDRLRNQAIAFLDQQGYPVEIIDHMMWWVDQMLDQDRYSLKGVTACLALVLRLRKLEKAAGHVCDAVSAIGEEKT